MGRRHLAEAGEAEVIARLTLGPWCRAPAVPAVPTVDPGGRKRGAPRRDVVVEQALRRVQDLALAVAERGEPLQQVVEVALGRLVAPDVLRRADRVELDAEAPV